MDLGQILIVEDDIEISRLLQTALHKEGYRTEVAADGFQAWNQIRNSQYDLVILDLMIPKMDGWEVLRRIRQEKNIPVLILSARTDQADKIVGLGLGADDYLTKPFQMGELIARVKAQLRRYLYMNTPSDVRRNAILKVGELELNQDTFEVTVGENVVSLTAKEYGILELLMEYPSRVFSKAQIFNRVWGEDYLSDENTVMVHIRRLRAKIEKESNEPKYIQTVWGIGYRLGKDV